MHNISADYIFPISSPPIKNGVITIDGDGRIVDIISNISEHPISTLANIQHHKGIICPGFINTHCHLELSHLRSQIHENKGMAGFVKEILTTRFNFSDKEIQQAIADAEKEMMNNGIVAVGDISNNNSTFKQKAKGNLWYHTFIEVFNMDDAKAEDTFIKGKQLQKELQPLSNSIVPHAPYTMSEKLLMLINEEAEATKSIITIHNQESKEESELFISKSGTLYELFKSMGINTDLIRETGVNSLRSTLPLIKDAEKILLVHNTYTTKEDIQFIKSQISNLKPQIYFCTCPNANIYIENNLPDYNLFIEEDIPVTIGTDSLASNWSLSILDEIKTIAKHFPHIPLQTLLTWATKNGAEFLGLSNMGTIEKGKKPGLNLLTNIDGMRITNETKVIPL